MTGRIPQSFINDLLARIDIVDVIEPRVSLKKAGKDYKACCPFHDEKTPSFTVSQQKQFFHCFGCGVSGTALKFLMEYERLDFVPAVESLAALAGLEVPRESGTFAPAQDNRLYDVMERVQRFFAAQLKNHPDAIEYLKGRGVSGITARDFGMGYAPPGWNVISTAFADVPEATLLELGVLSRNEQGRVYDKFRERIMFPIRDVRGRVVGFGGRVHKAEDGPKYLNSPETPIFHKGRELYGLYEARKAVRKLVRLIVVEGYLDVVSMAQAGIANCVAALGTAISTEQMRKLFRYVDEVTCCFDGDRAGRQAAWRALEASLPILTEGKRLRFTFLPETEDPDSYVRKYGKQQFLDQLDGAVSVVDHLFATLSQGLNLKSLDDRARLASLAAPHIEAVQPGILRQMMVAHLQGLTGSRLPAAGVPAKAARASAAERLSASKRLEERLYSLVLHKPHIALDVQLPAVIPPDSPLAVMVGYVSSHPDAMSDELLALWMGDALYERLLELSSRPLAVDDDVALKAEFIESIQRLADNRQRESRKLMLQEIRQEPTLDALRRLQEARSPESPQPAK
jgi:DNA primase